MNTNIKVIDYISLIKYNTEDIKLIKEFSDRLEEHNKLIIRKHKLKRIIKRLK